MKPLIPALILADSLTACATRAPSPAKQEREIAQFNRFGKTASTQEKVQLLDELVRKTNANLAGRGNEVFESIRISHHYPRSHALDYTLAIHPRFAQSLDLKKNSTRPPPKPSCKTSRSNPLKACAVMPTPAPPLLRWASPKCVFCSRSITA